MTNNVKCRVKKYDPNITKPPYKFIILGEFTCQPKDENDDYGVEFYARLAGKVREQGYGFKFYSLSISEHYDFDVVVSD